MGKVLGWLFGSAIAIAVIASATMIITPIDTVKSVKNWSNTAYEKVVDVFTPDNTTIDEPNEEEENKENEENEEEENKENTENGIESGDVNTEVTPQPSVPAE